MSLLQVKGLVKYYGRRAVVNGVDFEVNAGEVVGLLGPNGAGKTTSFRMSTGQITPNKGTVWFNGEDVTSLPMYLRARLGMGYLAQEKSVFRKLTVEQNIVGILEMLPKSRSLGRPLTKAERYERMESRALAWRRSARTSAPGSPAARRAALKSRAASCASRCSSCSMSRLPASIRSRSPKSARSSSSCATKASAFSSPITMFMRP
jgi:ABC-type branched-subunit amino acid transport system ATPase component